MANLRLEYDDQGEDYVGQNMTDDPVQGGELFDARQVEDDRDHYQPREHGRGARAADHHQDLVDEQGYEQDIERHPCGLRPRRDDGHHSNLAPEGIRIRGFYCNAESFGDWLRLRLYGSWSEGRTNASAPTWFVSLLAFGYSGLDFALGEAGFDFVAGVYGLCGFQELAFGIEDQGVSAVEDGQGR